MLRIDDGGARPLRLHEFYKLKIDGTFKRNNWSPYTYARALLHEFAIAFNSEWFAGAQPDLVKLGFPPDLPATGQKLSSKTITIPGGNAVFEEHSIELDNELIELVGLIEYRPGVIDEAIEQADQIDQFFSGIISFNRISHPETAKLAAFAAEVGYHVAMIFKEHYNRPRPSQLCPTLMPPIDPPEHASFPSGHAIQAWLTALLLDLAMIEALKPDPTDIVDPSKQTHPLHDMARRIARNREIMGLHYPSDSEAGRRLAYAAFKVIREKTGGNIRPLLDAAREEWDPGIGPLLP